MSLISGIQFIIHWKGFLLAGVFIFLRHLLHNTHESKNKKWNPLSWRDFYSFTAFTYTRIKRFFSGKSSWGKISFLGDRYAKRDMFCWQTRWLLKSESTDEWSHAAFPRTLHKHRQLRSWSSIRKLTKWENFSKKGNFSSVYFSHHEWDFFRCRLQPS